ncbi:zinc-binding alcohol dehydrogenase [Mycobacterium sp. NAZ190054]|uniref:zinc-dependent alcohol dehydrogenase n=1 Tax=Mycobacterium sp. NAZ190054 TaxID=1747766 RepID=UPI000795CC3D|nr:zinc-binding alcohol dehydrogenase [Mycobacterium sp. NAZ190054]KWX67774.1 zinc-binding alcohol dehydrogenase [Mycobacterium sp. NAZ190054]
MADRRFTVVVEGRGVVTLRDEPPWGPARDGQFDVETVFSGLSTGTDLSWVKGSNPALHSRWDAELGLFTAGEPDAGYPIEKFGYMQVGRVTDSATPAVAPGELVAMTYGHRSVHRADGLTERFVKLPETLEPVLGIYAAHMGPICANGLLHAAADIHGTDVRGLGDGVRGRRVAVTGAGVVGLLTALFARLHGAASTVLVDPTPARCRIAADLGFEALDPRDGDPAVVLKSRWRHGAGDRGADVVFQCRGQDSALALALRIVRPQGTVIDMAFYPAGCENVRLGEEFHHNGLSLRCAQIGRVPRGTGHVWDRDRLSAETLDLLAAEGDGIAEHVITEYAPLSEAPEVLTRLADSRHDGLQLVFTGAEWRATDQEP